LLLVWRPLFTLNRSLGELFGFVPGKKCPQDFWSLLRSATPKSQHHGNEMRRSPDDEPGNSESRKTQDDVECDMG
jgi:hypothetical protein